MAGLSFKIVNEGQSAAKCSVICPDNSFSDESEDNNYFELPIEAGIFLSMPFSGRFRNLCAERKDYAAINYL